MSGRYSDAFVDEVRARTSLLSLIGAEVKLVTRRGEGVGLCPFHSERTPSFTVSERKGFYHCFGCGAHGDAFDYLVERGRASGFLDAVEDLAIRAGLAPDREGRLRPAAKPIARPSAAELDTERADERERAGTIWRDSLPIAGSLAETYLRARGIDPARLPLWPTPPLRFHPSLPCWQRDRKTGQTWFAGNFPAMVGFVQGADRRFLGVHRTFLAPDGSDKAAVPKPKKMLGATYGGYLRLCPAASRMLTGEGIETTMSAMLATGRPGWAALSEGNLGAALPPIVTDLTLCCDNDTKDEANSERRIAQAVEQHSARGIVVRVAAPPRGLDFNDLLRRA